MKLFILLIIYSVQIIVKSQFINFQGPYLSESEHICSKPVNGIGYSVPLGSCINFSLNSPNFGSSNSFLESVISSIPNYYLSLDSNDDYLSITEYVPIDTTCSNSTSNDIISSTNYDLYECIETPNFQGLNLTTYSKPSFSKIPNYTPNSIVFEQYANDNCNLDNLLYSITFTSGYQIIDNKDTLTYLCKNGNAVLNTCKYSNGKCSDSIIQTTQCENNLNIFCSKPQQ